MGKGKGSVFGRIVDGWSFLEEINKEVKSDETGKPTHTIIIINVKHMTQEQWVLEVGLKKLLEEMDGDTKASLQVMEKDLQDKMRKKFQQNEETDKETEEKIKEEDNKETNGETKEEIKEEASKETVDETNGETKEEIKEEGNKETNEEAGGVGE